YLRPIAHLPLVHNTLSLFLLRSLHCCATSTCILGASFYNGRRQLSCFPARTVTITNPGANYVLRTRTCLGASASSAGVLEPRRCGQPPARASISRGVIEV